MPFSALIPTVLRCRKAGEAEQVHLAKDEKSVDVSGWQTPFSTEDEFGLALGILEPLLTLLSVAGYGVPEIVAGNPGQSTAERASLSLPQLTLRRGTSRDWDDERALLGLRVCPTTASPQHLSGFLAGFDADFEVALGGWLRIPLASKADPLTATAEAVDTLWAALVPRIARAKGEVGVHALIAAAESYEHGGDEPMDAALPKLVDYAKQKYEQGPRAVLDAEFGAASGGPALSEQIIELGGDALGLLGKVAVYGVLATSAELLWSRYRAEQRSGDHDDPDAAEPLALGDFEGLGFIRALLSFVGTEVVLDVGDSPATLSGLSDTPLARMMLYRETPAKVEAVTRAELPFVKRKDEAKDKAKPGAVAVTLAKYTFTISTKNDDWDTSKVSYAKISGDTSEEKLIHTLDFGRTRFDLEFAPNEGTIYEWGNSDASGLKSGKSDRTRFFCSAFSMWTLAAAGYDLDAALRDAKGRPHVMVDTLDERAHALTLYSLLNPQPERAHALGLILDKARGERDPDTGWSAWDLAELAAQYVDFEEEEPEMGPASFDDKKDEIEGATLSTGKGVKIVPKPATVKTDYRDPKTKATSIVDAVNAFAYDDLYDYDAQDEAEKPEGERDPNITRDPKQKGHDFDDNPAVMGSPGVIFVSGLGTRVAIQDIRPGDFGQYFEKASHKHEPSSLRYGKGHAFQIWSVKARAKLVADASGAPTVVDENTDDKGRVLCVLDRWTSPRALLNPGKPDAIEVVEYRVLEANVEGTKRTAAKSGGVSISDYRTLPPDPAKLAKGESASTYSVPTRLYYARLHESPWSDLNLGKAQLDETSPAASSPRAKDLAAIESIFDVQHHTGSRWVAQISVSGALYLAGTDIGLTGDVEIEAGADIQASVEWIGNDLVIGFQESASGTGTGIPSVKAVELPIGGTIKGAFSVKRIIDMSRVSPPKGAELTALTNSLGAAWKLGRPHFSAAIAALEAGEPLTLLEHSPQAYASADVLLAAVLAWWPKAKALEHQIEVEFKAGVGAQIAGEAGLDSALKLELEHGLAAGLRASYRAPSGYLELAGSVSDIANLALVSPRVAQIFELGVSNEAEAWLRVPTPGPGPATPVQFGARCRSTGNLRFGPLALQDVSCQLQVGFAPGSWAKAAWSAVATLLGSGPQQAPDGEGGGLVDFDHIELVLTGKAAVGSVHAWLSSMLETSKIPVLVASDEAEALAGITIKLRLDAKLAEEIGASCVEHLSTVLWACAQGDFWTALRSFLILHAIGPQVAVKVFKELVLEYGVARSAQLSLATPGMGDVTGTGADSAVRGQRWHIYRLSGTDFKPDRLVDAILGMDPQAPQRRTSRPNNAPRDPHGR